MSSSQISRENKEVEGRDMKRRDMMVHRPFDVSGIEEIKMKRKKKIMFSKKDHTGHSLERYLFQKILFLLKLMLQ